MVTAVGLPLLIVNGKFQSLGSMTVKELETFIPFLVNCSLNRAGAQVIDGVPEWWSSVIRYKFPLQKPKGLSEAGYRQHLSAIVCSCYWYHDAQYLLPFCAKIAQNPESVILKTNDDNTTSVFYVQTVRQILKFNNENKNYDRKPKKEKPSRQSILSPVSKKPVIISDIYLCENCDAEFYSYAEVLKHEKECHSNVVNDVRNNCKKDSGGGGGRDDLASPNVTKKNKQETLPVKNKICSDVQAGPSIGKEDFLKYLFLQPKSNERVREPSKLKYRTRSHGTDVNCLHKFRNIEFSSVLGRKISENCSKHESVNKTGRNFLINEYYCSTNPASRIYREHKEPMDFKVTCRKPKRNAWSHQYSFNKKQRRSRCLTLKTGLNERSRKLLKKCKQLRVVVKRLNIVS